MKRLKKRKGITLAEVIISLILLTIIVVGMMGYFSDSYRNIFALRDQTKIHFDVQEKFEQQMAEIRKDGGNGTDVKRFEYRVGTGVTKGIDVVGTTLTYDDSIKKMRLFVANKKESVLEIPDDLTVEVANAKRYYYVGEKTPVGNVALRDTVPSSVKIYTEPGWFLSYRTIKDNGSAIVPVGTLADSKGETVSQAVFPKMLDDFEQISSQTNSITITDQMRGKYLTFAGRAINSFGRVGNYQEIDQRMWIMGIPIVDGLQLHTDADLAVMNDGTAIPTINTPQKTVDIRNYRSNVKYNGVPVLNVYEQSIKQARQLISLGTQTMQFSRNDIRNGYTTSVLIGNRPQVGALLTYRLTNNLLWSLSLNENGQIVIEYTDTTGLNKNQPVTTTQPISYTTDNSVQVRSTVDNGNLLKMEVFVNGGAVYNTSILLSGRPNGTRTQVNHNVSSVAIVFGGNTYINEFATFSRALSDTEINQMATYFNEKYLAK